MNLDVAAARAGRDQLDPCGKRALQSQSEIARGRRFPFRRRSGPATVFTFAANQRLDLADGKPTARRLARQSFDDYVVL